MIVASIAVYLGHIHKYLPYILYKEKSDEISFISFFLTKKDTICEFRIFYLSLSFGTDAENRNPLLFTMYPFLFFLQFPQ